jgi:hypothetical protein
MTATTQAKKVPVKWIAHGHLGAYQGDDSEGLRAKLHKALAEMESEDVFIAVFETLNWLDARLAVVRAREHRACPGHA